MDLRDLNADVDIPLDYKIVVWNGKERVQLKLDGIDDATKTIVLVAEDFYQDVNAEKVRRHKVDTYTTINTLEDAKAYMDDVLARGPLEGQ